MNLLNHELLTNKHDNLYEHIQILLILNLNVHLEIVHQHIILHELN